MRYFIALCTGTLLLSITLLAGCDADLPPPSAPLIAGAEVRQVVEDQKDRYQRALNAPEYVHAFGKLTVEEVQHEELNGMKFVTVHARSEDGSCFSTAFREGPGGEIEPLGRNGCKGHNCERCQLNYGHDGEFSHCSCERSGGSGARCDHTLIEGPIPTIEG